MTQNIKIIKTTSPKKKPETKDLKFGRIFTDHMLTIEYDSKNGWGTPVIEPYGAIAMEPSSMVIHYGQSVFEGLKAYKSKEGKISLFRPEKNLERLNSSHERLCIPKIDEKLVMDCLVALLEIDKDWIPDEDGTSLYIRPFTFATQPALGVHPSENYKFMIILCPVGAYYTEGLNPVKILIEDYYVRSAVGGLGYSKASANYASSLKGQEKAIELGYSQVLWLDAKEHKYIEEVGSMNIFFKIKGEVVTPDLCGSILPGITRDSVITVLKDWGIKVSEKKISVDEIYEAFEKGELEEAFGTGTAAVISPISEFNWKGKTIVLNNGKIGELSQRLYDEITGIQTGKIVDKFGFVSKL